MKTLLVLFMILLLSSMAAAIDDMSLEMVFVKGGCYMMGNNFDKDTPNELPLHEVCVKDFNIGKYEVTQGLWKEIMGENPSMYQKGDKSPVEQVSWEDVQAFLKKLNEKTGRKYRLPTEAEWEYACRSGGKKEKYSGTSDDAEVKDYAWFWDNLNKKTQPVGQKKPNGLGIHDMGGNVREWVEDVYSEEAYTKHDKNNPIYKGNGLDHAGRGGGWDDDPRFTRCSYRAPGTPDCKGGQIGLRLVLGK